jgi:hypothetical protein
MCGPIPTNWHAVGNFLRVTANNKGKMNKATTSYQKGTVIPGKQLALN